MNKETDNTEKTTDQPLQLSALLCEIEKAEKVKRDASAALNDLQHKYLIVVGYTIEQAQGGFAGDLVYRVDGEAFIDIDDAMDYWLEST